MFVIEDVLVIEVVLVVLVIEDVLVVLVVLVVLDCAYTSITVILSRHGPKLAP